MRRTAGIVSSLLLLGAAGAQQMKPGVCIKDRSVDDYVAELRKMETKKGTHNPLPNDICIFAMCAHPPGGPGEPKAKQPPPAPAPPPKPPANDNESSSKRDVPDVPQRLQAPAAYDPIEAAHAVDVGDYYFGEKNYRAALMRYADARENKPGDAAIHIRMGKTLEKLDELERAYVEYDAAAKLELEGKYLAEAKQAMQRLAPELKKKGLDPEALARDNEPEQAPCLRPATD